MPTIVPELLTGAIDGTNAIFTGAPYNDVLFVVADGVTLYYGAPNSFQKTSPALGIITLDTPPVLTLDPKTGLPAKVFALINAVNTASGSSRPDASGLLVDPWQLSRFNVPSFFLAQFAPAPFEIHIEVGGALGAMAFSWRPVGDENWSATIYSSAASPWCYTLDPVFADLTFAPAAYHQGDVFQVDALGNVTTISTSGIVAASLFDLRLNACTSVTAEALARMRDAIKQPLISWTDDFRTHAAAMVYAVLKRGRGATPSEAGTGDENIFLAETAARQFFDLIGRNGKPDGVIDSSVSPDGELIPQYPIGDCLRGW